jgi:serine/threonine protein kinase
MPEQLVVTRIHSALDSFVSHHRATSVRVGDELTIGDERDAGGFGRIVPVLSIRNETPQVALLVKEFRLGSSHVINHSDIISAVCGLHGALRSTPQAKWIADLLAVPFLIASVVVLGQERLVTFMLDLKPLGFQSAPFIDKEDRKLYLSSSTIGQRIDLAMRYAQLAALLEQLRFVHGDQNPENLMIDQSAIDLQLIDFDAGVIVQTGDERPLTPGHQDAFMPPEVKGSGTEPPHITKYDLTAERWSVGLMIGQILFGATHPAFFLRAVSAKALDEYARSGYRWPDIDTNSDLFRTNALASYKRFRRAIDTLPGPIIDQFGTFFSAGVEGDRRPTAASWMSVIDDVRCAPEFTSLTVSPTYILEGTQATIRWSTSQAEWVKSPEFGRLPPEGEASLVVSLATRFTFVAVNRWGAREQSVSAHVVPLPHMRLVSIPDFPGLNVHAAIPTPDHPLAYHNPFPTAPSLDRFFSANADGVSIERQVPQLPTIPDFLSVDLAPWQPMSDRWWSTDTDSTGS